MSRDELVVRYGDPLSSMTVGDREIATYDSGKVVLQNGKVLSCDFSAKAGSPKVAERTVSPSQPLQSGWLTDFEKAKIQASASKRKMLVLFTGSTWCPACIRFEQVIGRSPQFLQAAQKNFVLVKLDFPREQLPMNSKNLQLAQRYEITGYPTLISMRADGQGESQVDVFAALNKPQAEVETMIGLLGAESGAKKPQGKTILFVVAGLVAVVWWFKRR
ncbi:MAG: DUF953 domain-containing protein [Verrucomicrobia bacterium]|nr:DUF953 domain-containing protein [Verrucomicrobiota bacterium]